MEAPPSVELSAEPTEGVGVFDMAKNLISVQTDEAPRRDRAKKRISTAKNNRLPLQGEPLSFALYTIFVSRLTIAHRQTSMGIHLETCSFTSCFSVWMTEMVFASE